MDLIPNFKYGYMSAIEGKQSPQQLQDIGPAFEVTKFILSLDSDTADPKVEIFVNDHGAKSSFIMPVSEIYDIRSVCHPLCKYGVIMDKQYQHPIVKLILDGISHCKSTGAVEYGHRTLGWSDIRRTGSFPI